MDWPTLWQTWYCLGRQQYPSIAISPDRFERYLRRHRDVLLGADDVAGAAATQAYLVAGALARNERASRALLDLSAQDGRRLEECLHRVARRHCLAHAQDVVSELLLRWYAGTPKNEDPLLARWPPTGDFSRYFLITIKRLAVACTKKSSEFQPLTEGIADQPGFKDSPSAGGGGSVRNEHDTQPTTFAQLVECFIGRLARGRFAERKLCIVAIASQASIAAKMRQKQIAGLLKVSEPTITRDIRAITTAQEACIKSLDLEEESSASWWWADVRATAAEHPKTRAAVQSLMSGRLPTGEAGDP